MSKRERPSGGDEDRWSLQKRRVALGIYLAFLVTCLVGSQGPWWQVVVKDKPLEPTMGSDVGRYSWTPSQDPAQPMVRQETALRPAVVVALLCAVAFFFSSYDLVADADIQLPVFLVSLGLCLVGAKVFYDAYYDQQVIKEVVEVIETRHVQRQLEAGGVAAVASGTVPDMGSPSQGLKMRILWGLALFLSASLVMLIDSAYLTFIAQRTKGKT